MGKTDKIYAVSVGRKPGIYYDYKDVQKQCDGYPGAVQRRCKSEAEARQVLADFFGADNNVFTGASASADKPKPTRTLAGARAAAAPYALAARSPAKRAAQAQAAGGPRALEDAIVAYTDGASKNNQSARDRVAGYGVHWARGRPAHVDGDIAARCPGTGQTNNIGELWAIIRTLELTRDDPRPLRIYSDSMYGINCFGWARNWEQYDWRKKDGSAVLNVGMVRYMVALQRLRLARGWGFQIEHVKGHADSVGNNTADALANDGCLRAGGEEPDWDARRREVEALIESVVGRGGAAAVLRETAGPAADDFSDIPILDEAALLAELSD